MGFLTGLYPSAIAVVLSLILFVYLTYKGMDLIPVAILCAVVVAVTAKSGFFDVLFTTFMTETSAFFSSVFLPFISGGILGSVMLASGCSMSIGQALVKWLGPTRTPYIIMLLCIPFQLAGIATAPFIIIPIAFSLLKASNLPRRVGLAAAMGVTYSAMVTLPATACPGNLIPTYYLGTDLMAGAAMGIICFVFSFVIIALYVKFLIWDAHRIGDGYDGVEDGPAPGGKMELPHVAIAILPILIVVFCAVFTTDILGDSYRAATLGQILGSIFIIVTCRKYFTNSIGKVITMGIKPNIEFTVGICLVVGYAAVVQQTVVYDVAMNAVLGLNIHPYLLTFVACGLICGMCANGYGGMGIFLGAMGAQLAAMPNVDVGAIHRLTSMTSTTFDSLPHCSSIQINLGLWKMSVKEGYKYCFITTVLSPLLYTLLGIIIACVMY